MLSRVPTRGGRLPRLLALLLILLLYITATLPAVQPAGAQSGGGSKIANIPDNPYGVNVFLHKEVEAWKIEETLRMVAAANIKWIKQEFPWNEIEFRKGYFQDDKWNKSSWEKFDNIVNLAGKYGLTIIARVDHPPDWAKAPAGGDSPIKDNADLADFTNALLDHYGDKIKYVQLWNEPNLSAEWVPGKAVDPSAYAAMLKAVYPTVKDAHPKAIVLSAPMAMTLEGPEKRGNMNDLDYWNKLYDAGVKGSFDIASANGYGLDQPPDAPPDPQVLNFRRAELLRDIMVKHGDSARPIWFDEYGWNASPESLSEEEKNYWRHVTLAQQAQWTVEGVRYARRNWPWAGVISVWYFRQVGDIPPDKAEYYFQMVDPEFVPQPVYNSVKVDAGTRYPGPAASPLPTAVNLPPTPTKASDQPTPTPTPPVATGTPQTSPTTSAATPTASPTQATTPTEAPAQPTPTAVPAPPPTSTNTTLVMYVVGGLFLVGGLAGLGYYFMRGKGAT